jgi:ABC-type glycerol-3-phosphate transport system substrate-binding protein
VRFTSTEGEAIADVLDDRLAAGDPPDVAVLPQPALLARYARAGVLVPVDELVADEIGAFADVWQALGTVDGELYGVWFKAANKSLVWYSIAAFEAAGVVPPVRLDRFAAVAAAVATPSRPAFAVPDLAGDAWTYTDLFENLYLRIAGPDRYDALAAHRLAWTDPTVVETLEAMAALVGPGDVAASEAGSSFADAVGTVFSTSPTAAMVAEGDFVPGVAGERGAEIGIDVDVFSFPERDGDRRFVVGGGDAAVLLRSTAAGRALIRFLATPEAAEVWAARGGFLSPNEDVDLATYPDDTTRRIARALFDAGEGFRFDLSDLQPVAFGGTDDAALWTVLRAFAADPADPVGTARLLEAAASAAWRGEPEPTVTG